MKVFRISQLPFRAKIIISLAFGIITLSALSFTAFNYLLKRTVITINHEDVEYINLLRDHLYFSIGEHDGRIIRSMLKNMEKEKGIEAVYLADENSAVTYPESHLSLGSDTAEIPGLYSAKGDVTIKSYKEGPEYFNRVFIRLQNKPACTACHDAGQRNLGMIILDMQDKETGRIISITRRFSLIFTLLLLAIIFILVAYMHYRFIRRSLGQFKLAIGQVNMGNLETRLTIPEAKELGTLGKNFNEMLDTFERTQRELQQYHRNELESAQKLATIGEMSARIAHEIRNPVTGIARALEILIADHQEEGNKQILEEIQRQAGRVEQAISNLLRYSRSQEVKLLEGDVNNVIRSMVFFLRHQAYDKKVNFGLDLQEELPVVFFDHELIENVLLNVTFNAVKFIPEDGTVILRSSFDENKRAVIISIEDNGTGIPDDLKEEVFKPFFTTHTKGTGLGLAISREIVEKHNGRIWFRNNDGPGCTFYICLPVRNGRK